MHLLLFFTHSTKNLGKNYMYILVCVFTTDHILWKTEDFIGKVVFFSKWTNPQVTDTVQGSKEQQKGFWFRSVSCSFRGP